MVYIYIYLERDITEWMVLLLLHSPSVCLSRYDIHLIVDWRVGYPWASVINLHCTRIAHGFRCRRSTSGRFNTTITTTRTSLFTHSDPAAILVAKRTIQVYMSRIHLKKCL